MGRLSAPARRVLLTCYTDMLCFSSLAHACACSVPASLLLLFFYNFSLSPLSLLLPGYLAHVRWCMHPADTATNYFFIYFCSSFLFLSFICLFLRRVIENMPYIYISIKSAVRVTIRKLINSFSRSINLFVVVCSVVWHAGCFSYEPMYERRSTLVGCCWLDH